MAYIKRTKKKKPSLGSPTYVKLMRDHSFGFKNQVELFLHKWEMSDKVCPISKMDLNNIPKSRWVNMFAHILPKGKYSLWKFNPDNIVVIHPDIHYLYDFGTKEQRDKSGYDFSMLYELKELLRTKYELYAREN